MIAEAPLACLTPRWTRMRPHPVQHAYWRSLHRFNTVPAGRRSGKTEIAKRKLVKRSLYARTSWSPRFFAGAPVRDQAKRIFWEDLKALTPKDMLAGRPSESDLMIPYITGAQIWVVGLDVPERIEGSPWDGGIVDEIANCDPDAWPKHIRPALADRNGWADLIGVPEGRNHYYEYDSRAKALMKEFGDSSEWASFHWKSAEILSAAEITSAKEDLDELTYQQEYEASFVNFQGRAYYPFLERTHCAKLTYRKEAPLILTFDFNVEPGTAAISQEQKLPSGQEGTGIIGEVWIPRNSSTDAVCSRIIQDWGSHSGLVRCYGDATGGARGSAKVQGSDWDIIWQRLKPVFSDRLRINMKKKNPAERARINAVNTRLKSRDGRIRLMVDPFKAPHVVKDFEGVTLLEGGSGEIDKKKSPELTHLTDGIGYYEDYEFPVIPGQMEKIELGGV